MSGDHKAMEMSSSAPTIRDTGVKLIGGASWGTHICQFYRTWEDILEVLIPYFEAGLAGNEFCMWVTSHPLTVANATQAMRQAVPGFEDYQEKGQILIVPHTDWYLKDGRFDSNRVIAGWISMLDHALEEGFDGLRVTGNAFPLADESWSEIKKYEAEVNGLISDFPILAICGYPLDKCSSEEIIDVVAAHQFALVKRGGIWETIESPQQRRTREALEREQSAKQAYLDLAGVLMVAVDTKGNITMVNRKGSEILGLPADEIVGKDWFENFFTEDIRDQLRPGFDQIMAGFDRPGAHYETPVINHQGEEKIIAWHYTLLRDAEGIITGILGSGNDITQLKFNEKKLRQAMRLNEALNTINMTINSTLDLEQIICRVMSESAEVMGADSLAIICQASEGLWSIEHVYGEPGQEGGTKFKTGDSWVARHILTRNEPVVIKDTADVPADTVLLANSANLSFLATPLCRRTQVTGMITFEYNARIEFSEAQIDFAKKLAASLSLSYENARLYRYEQDSRADIQSYATRLSLLHEIGLSLGQETDRDRLLESILASAAEMTSAGVGIMILINKGRTETVSQYYAPWYKAHRPVTKDVSSMDRRLRLLMSGSSRNVVRIPGLTNGDISPRMPEGHPHLRGLLIGELTDARRRTLGYFLLSDKAGGADFNPEDEEIISLLAAQSSVALLSAENFEREHSIAVTLQSTLLPQVPSHDKAEVGLKYRSASTVGRIGGDFYDFIDLGNDTIAVAVGDVCGKGLDAAAYTAMVKFTLRAHLEEGLSPGDCLTRLNILISKNLEPEKFLTLGLAVLDLTENRLTYSLAGHPQPVISQKGGVFALKTPNTLPLGVLGEYYFSTHESQIPQDMTLLMYTDGITEARSPNGELFGYKRLMNEFHGARSLPTQKVAQNLVDSVMEFSGHHLNDDVAVLVVRPRT